MPLIRRPDDAEAALPGAGPTDSPVAGAGVGDPAGAALRDGQGPVQQAGVAGELGDDAAVAGGALDPALRAAVSLPAKLSAREAAAIGYRHTRLDGALAERWGLKDPPKDKPNQGQPAYRWHPSLLSAIASRCSPADLDQTIADLDAVQARCHISRVQAKFLRRVRAAIPTT